MIDKNLARILALVIMLAILATICLTPFWYMVTK